MEPRTRFSRFDWNKPSFDVLYSWKEGLFQSDWLKWVYVHLKIASFFFLFVVEFILPLFWVRNLRTKHQISLILFAFISPLSQLQFGARIVKIRVCDRKLCAFERSNFSKFFFTHARVAREHKSLLLSTIWVKKHLKII